MANNPKKVSWLFLVTMAALAMPIPAWADAVANITRDGAAFLSDSKLIRAVIAGGATFFTVYRQGTKLYDSTPANPDLKLGKLMVANDGRHVVWMLQSRYLGPGAKNADELPAVIFYQDGKVLKSYSLGALLVRKNLVSHSTSHVQWISFPRSASGTPAPKAIAFEPDGSSLSFETTSFRRYKFDPRTGALLSGEDSPIYRDADLILYGKLTQPNRAPGGPCLVTIGEAKVVKGSLPPLPLEAQEDPCSYTSEGQWATVALKNINGQWKVIASSSELTTLFNVLP